MSLVGRNIVANLIGGALLTAMMVVLTPLQVRLLGMEAYGVIGFINTLQLAFTAFDLGLSSTLTREIAADKSPGKQASRCLLQTAMTIYWGGGLVIGAALVLAADNLASGWFTGQQLSPATLTRSLQIIAVFLALRWPIALYAGVLGGLQRLDLLNVVKVSTLAIRMVGGLIVLLQWRTLEAFLWWTVLSAILEVVAYDLVCRRAHADLPRRPGISMAAVRRVWRFSASMNLLAVLSVVLVQLDRLLISRLLPLDQLGLYSVAYYAASLVTLAIGAIGSAVLPHLASSDDRSRLLPSYRQADRMTLLIITPIAFTLIGYGEALLAVWIDPATGRSAAPALAVLAFGFWLSAAVLTAYNVAVATGRPGWLVKTNVVVVLPYALLLGFAIERLGIVGAALAWVALNLVYAAVLVPLAHRTILQAPTRDWLLRTLLPFLGLALLCFVLPAGVLRANGGAASPLPAAAALAFSLVLWVLSTYLAGMLTPALGMINATLARLKPARRPPA